MRFKNTSQKVIGFGAMHIVPGAEDNLPSGYDASHPLVKFYVSQGWLEEVKTSKVNLAPEPETNPDDEVLDDEVPDDVVLAPQTADDLVKKVKALETLSLDKLKALAAELEIGVTNVDTKATLKQKITDVYQAQ